MLSPLHILLIHLQASAEHPWNGDGKGETHTNGAIEESHPAASHSAKVQSRVYVGRITVTVRDGRCGDRVRGSGSGRGVRWCWAGEVAAVVASAAMVAWTKGVVGCSGGGSGGGSSGGGRSGGGGGGGGAWELKRAHLADPETSLHVRTPKQERRSQI